MKKWIKIIKKVTMENKSFMGDSFRVRNRYHRIRKKNYLYSENGSLRLEKPIFIIGFPHSGTSVLVDIFKTHPDVADWTEATEVWEPNWVEGETDNEYDKLIPKYEKDVKKNDELRINDAFLRYVRSQKKKRLVNKNPRNTVRILYIKKSSRMPK